MHLAPGTKARHYFVQAMVPSNADTPFLFTSGVCNDNEPGWGCDYPDQPALPAAANETVPLGISEGRSNGCHRSGGYREHSGNLHQLGLDQV